MTRSAEIYGQGPAFDLLRLSLATQGDKPRAQKAGRAVLRPRISAEEAFATTLRHCLAHLAVNARAAEIRQADGVHQLRVGLRRLRAAITAYGPAFRNPMMEGIRDRARSLGRALSQTREFDVFDGEILAAVEEAAPGLPGLVSLRLTLDVERQNSWDETVLLLRSERFAHFLIDLAHLVDREAWREGAKSTKDFKRPARKLARESLDKRLRKTCKHAKHLATLNTEARHRLRITLKKLRYASEFFAPLFHEKDVARFLSKLSKLQDVFGTLNDVAGAETVLKKLVDSAEPASQKSMQDAAAFVLGWHRNRAKSDWTKAKARWKRFEKTEPFWS